MFAFEATCQACGGDLAVDSLTNARQTRRAAGTCTECGKRWEITVTMTRATDRPTNAGPRLPWAPLARHLPPDVGDTARALGITTRTVHRWRADGIALEHAERAAMALGRHPVEIWGGAYHVAANEPCEAA